MQEPTGHSHASMRLIMLGSTTASSRHASNAGIDSLTNNSRPHCKVSLSVIPLEAQNLYCIQHVTDVANCCNLLCHAHMVKIETMSAIKAHLCSMTAASASMTDTVFSRIAILPVI